MYHLENIGWKVTAIGNSQYAGAQDFNITHRIFAPFGMILQRKTIKEVIQYIEETFLSNCKFIDYTAESAPRREYAFRYAHDQEAFAELWNGWSVTRMVNGNWIVLI